MRGESLFSNCLTTRTGPKPPTYCEREDSGVAVTPVIPLSRQPVLVEVLYTRHPFLYFSSISALRSGPCNYQKSYHQPLLHSACPLSRSSRSASAGHGQSENPITSVKCHRHVRRVLRRQDGTHSGDRFSQRLVAMVGTPQEYLVSTLVAHPDPHFSSPHSSDMET